MANNFNTRNSIDNKFIVNGQIRANNVRIVGENIESRIVSIFEARKLAESLGLDMIQISNGNGVPIVKIANYEKMLYEQKKREKKSKQSTKPIKEIRLTVNIASHDMETKLKQANKFISEGSKVKVVLTMKGRELSRREENKKSILEFVSEASEFAIPESMPKDMGNKVIVMLKPKK